LASRDLFVVSTISFRLLYGFKPLQKKQITECRRTVFPGRRMWRAATAKAARISRRDLSQH
jgi:hypothetical protein